MNAFTKLLGVGRVKPPNPEEVQNDISEASEKMTSVEASLRALKVRLEVMSHREASPR